MDEVKATDPVSKWIKAVSWLHDQTCLIDHHLANYLATHDPRWQETEAQERERRNYKPHVNVDEEADAAYISLRRQPPATIEGNTTTLARITTKQLEDWVLVDYDDDDEVLGVELLLPTGTIRKIQSKEDQNEEITQGADQGAAGGVSARGTGVPEVDE